MNDPLHFAIGFLLQLFSAGPETFFIALLTVAMVVCMFLPNMMERERRKREAEVTRQCRVLVSRIESILPAYREAMIEYVKQIEGSINENAVVDAFVENIPHEVIIKSERDFCQVEARNPKGKMELLQMEVSNLFK